MHITPHSASEIIYQAAVIGAGPAGLACVGNLLDVFGEKGGHHRILWIDPEFGGGRLTAYPLVPSNTKVNLFTKFASECRSFEATKSSPTFLNLLNNFDGLKGCELKWAGEMCKELTEAVLEKKDQVEAIKSRVQILQHSKSDKVWRISTSCGQNFETELVFMATGSAPKSLSNSPAAAATCQTIIHLDDALNPEILSTKISFDDVVGVYGSSHSAMLVLKNLLINCANKPKLVVNYYRQEAKFAEYPDPIKCPDKILHDNTGLKGEVADWVRTWNDLSSEALAEAFGGALLRFKVGQADNSIICNKNIFAVGYARNPLPAIIYDSVPIDTESIDYDCHGNINACSGLYGFGIAFPERVKDLTGEDEMAVGLWKFMKHIKKSINFILSNE